MRRSLSMVLTVMGWTGVDRVEPTSMRRAARVTRWGIMLTWVARAGQ